MNKKEESTNNQLYIHTTRIPDGILSLLVVLSTIMGAIVLLSNILAIKIWGFRLPSSIVVPLIGLKIPLPNWTFTFDAGLLLFPFSFLARELRTWFLG